MSRPPWGKVAGVSLTEGGNSLSILDCPTTNAPIPTTTVQLTRTTHARPYNPPWGKVAGVSLTEGGNSLSILDCPTTNAPIPTTTVQLTRTTHARPYNPASELPLSDTLTGATSPQRATRKRAPPLRHPNGCHLSPKGEALVYAAGVCTTVLSLLASIIGSRNL